MSYQAASSLITEIENLLAAIRARLLLHSNSGTMPGRSDSLFSLVSDLPIDLRLHESPTIPEAIKELAAAINPLCEITPETKIASFRQALDKISAVESRLAEARRRLDPLDLDISEFVESAIDKLVVSPIPPVESVSPKAYIGEDIDAELLEIFRGEADELLHRISACLHKLSLNSDDREALWQIRRSAHTFKGSAGIVGLTAASRIAHNIEDILDQFSESSPGSRSNLLRNLSESVELLRAFTAADDDTPENRYSTVKTQCPEQSIEPNNHLYNSLRAVSIANPLDLQTTKPADKTSAKLSADERREPIIRVRLSHLNELDSAILELLIEARKIERRFKELRHQNNELLDAGYRFETANERIETALEFPSRGDDLYSPISTSEMPGTPQDFRTGMLRAAMSECTYKLSETTADVLGINAELSSHLGSLKNLYDRQKERFEFIRDRLVGLRMVEFGSIKTRLERAARVTAEETDRMVEFYLGNREELVDTQMLDHLTEPLMHLVKNAVVHGIEVPDMRRFLGKPERGTVSVSCVRSLTRLTIIVRDDGSGIAMAALRQKAVERGQFTAAEAYSLSDPDISNLIFESGLTTAEKLSMNAGRGVGMTIVKNGVESMGGSISVRSKPQLGTEFTIRLPLKISALEVLIVRANGQLFGLPLEQVVHITSKAECDLRVRNGRTVVLTGRGEFGLINLNLGPNNPEHNDSDQVIAFVRTDEGHSALMVDEVERTAGIIFESRSDSEALPPEILGTAVIDEGTIPVLNIDALSPDSGKWTDAIKTAGQTPATDVLVVDDSPSVRLKITNVLENAGWHTAAASSGGDAIEILQSAPEPPRLILTDIEMPGVNGLELISSLRASSKFCDVPIVVISSRSDERHRTYAEKLGVSRFLTKPFDVEELIETVTSVVKAEVKLDPVNAD